MSDRLIVPARPVCIVSSGSCVGREEMAGPLGKYFDMTDDSGSEDRFGMDSFEKSEAQMQRIALDIALGRAGIAASDAAAVFSGDLQNQCAASAYATSAMETPHFGLFGACSTCAESLILAAIYASSIADTVLAVTSSHNCSAERQFRFPLEYGAQRPPTAQWTVTGAGAFVVSASDDAQNYDKAKLADCDKADSEYATDNAVGADNAGGAGGADDKNGKDNAGGAEGADDSERSGGRPSNVSYTAGDGAVRAFAARTAGGSPNSEPMLFADTCTGDCATCNACDTASDITDDAPDAKTDTEFADTDGFTDFTPSNLGGVASPDRSMSAELAPPFPEGFDDVHSADHTDAEFSVPLTADPPVVEYQEVKSSGNDVRIIDMLPGISRDFGINDANDMGAAMAPAACDTLVRYFKLTDMAPKDYDLILTGDLGVRGKSLLADLLASHGIDTAGRLDDCGAMIYDIDRQDKHSGGSGCGCSASVLASYILPRLRSGELRDVLFVATGALMNPQALMQGENIVGIAHLVHLRSCGKEKV